MDTLEPVTVFGADRAPANTCRHGRINPSSALQVELVGTFWIRDSGSLFAVLHESNDRNNNLQ